MEFDLNIIVTRLLNEAADDDRCAQVAGALAAAWKAGEWEPGSLLARIREMPEDRAA